MIYIAIFAPTPVTVLYTELFARNDVDLLTSSDLDHGLRSLKI